MYHVELRQGLELFNSGGTDGVSGLTFEYSREDCFQIEVPLVLWVDVTYPGDVPVAVVRRGSRAEVRALCYTLEAPRGSTLEVAKRPFQLE